MLFDTRDWISKVESDSLEMLKRTLMLVLVTVISLEVSGTAEAKFHSSSSSAVALLCVKLVDGAGMPPPSRSTAPDATGGGLTDCWYWKGELWRGVDVRAAKGSGVRAGCIGGGEKVDGVGDVIWDCVGFGPAEKRSVMAWFDAFCDCGTAIPDMPRTKQCQLMNVHRNNKQRT